jgi:hypothetical protein
MQQLSNKAFIREFKRQHFGVPPRPFCWVLGSGASKSSNIPMGRELADKWIQEMYDNVVHPKPPPSIKDWANNVLKKEIPHFDYDRRANFYPYVYRERFKFHPEHGFGYLQDTMANAKPRVGYKILAQIMSKPNSHNVAITTNFDNLIEYSISQYTKEAAFVCGHELLAPYVIENIHRPTVAKIHRDLFLAPMSRPEQISRLAQEWEVPLKKIFSDYTPIVIGYGESGGSLMQFLEELPIIKGGIYWCYVEEEPGKLPAEEVQTVVRRHRGCFVPILGFDELMLQLFDAMKLTSTHQIVLDRTKELIESYHKDFSEEKARILSMEHADMSETVESTILSIKSAMSRLAEDGL